VCVRLRDRVGASGAEEGCIDSGERLKIAD
jgi:hypothetical protein